MLPSHHVMSRLVHDCQGGGIHVILMQSHWLFGRLCRILYHLILWCIYVCFYIKCLQRRLESDVKKEKRNDDECIAKTKNIGCSNIINLPTDTFRVLG